MSGDGAWTGGAVGESAYCVLAPNAGPMTLDGTNTWLLSAPGSEQVVVVDPGPDDEAHLERVVRVAAERAGRVGLVVLTHQHLDHSAGAPGLAARTGAPVRALDPRRRLGEEGLTPGEVVAAAGKGMPVLGICLGGQMLAHVAGGVVQESYGEPEAGSTPLTLEPAAADDPLFSALPPQVTAIEHHKDAITALPPEAVWLARSERCAYQAFRLGRAAWGLQFHPESSAEQVAGWDRAALIRDGFDPDAIVTAARRDEPASAAVWRRFASRFATVVAGEHRWAEHH